MRARRTIATLSGATLALTVAMVGTGTLSSANATGPVVSPAGTLTLSTSSPAGVTYAPASGTGGFQAIGTSGKCSLSPATGAYLAFSANTGVAGYNAGSIGVSSSNKTSGTACGQVNKDANEALVVALNSASLVGAVGPIKASTATLDIEVKSDAWIKAELFDGGTAAGVFELQTGSSIGRTDPGATITPCNKLSDSGPDAGSADNCRWTISGQAFTSMKLTALVGSFSLEGGGDWGATAASNRSVFTLVSIAEGELNCDTSRVATQAGGTGSITDVTITRLENGATDPNTGLPVECVALPYDLAFSGSTAVFHKPLTTGQETAQFSLAVSRSFPAGTANPLPAARVDWEDGQPSQPIPYCATGVITGIDSTTNLPTVDFTKVTTALDQSKLATTTTPKSLTQYACVYKQAVTIGGDGGATASDWVYFTGDIKFPTA